MAVTVRNSSWGGSSSNTSELLVAFISDEIKVLEPDLQYARLGKRKDSKKGFDRILFPQTNQIPVQINVTGPTVTSNGSSLGASSGGSVWGAGASIMGQAAVAPGAPVASTVTGSTFGVAAITEGTNPTAITWGATSYSAGPSQYGILVQVSDLLVQDSAIEVVQSASTQVKNALARLVDTALQTVVNAGTNGVIYSGGKTTRAGLGAGDTITQNDMVKSVTRMRAANAAGVKPFSGSYYVAVIHPNSMADLMTNSNAGSWLDAARFTSIDDLKAGKISEYRGVKYFETAYQNYFNSTTNVMPTTVLGEESFGWGFWQTPEPILTTTPDSNNPLNLYSSIGGKVTLGATRFEDTLGTQRIQRIESGFTV